MKQFIASKAYSLLTFLVFAGVTTLAFFLLKPAGADISNSEIIRVFSLAGWFTGLATALLSLVLFGILKLLNRLFGLGKNLLTRVLILLLSLLPWLVMSWQILGEPRYTNIGKAIIDFVARPMLWGSLSAMLFALILGLSALLSPKKAK